MAMAVPSLTREVAWAAATRDEEGIVLGLAGEDAVVAQLLGLGGGLDRGLDGPGGDLGVDLHGEASLADATKGLRVSELYAGGCGESRAGSTRWQ